MSRTEPSSWQDAMPGYRARWEERYGARGARWEDYEPAYRYAWEQTRSPGIQYGRSWADVEPGLRVHWAEQHADVPWERAEPIVREVWEESSDSGRMLYKGDQRAPQAGS